MNPAESYLLDQPSPFKEILLFLDNHIKRLPDIELLYRWKIPFYYTQAKPFCYLNHTRDYVDLGFWDGRRLLDLDLERDNRKMIGSLRYRSLEEVDVERLDLVLKRAYKIRVGDTGQGTRG